MYVPPPSSTQRHLHTRDANHILLSPPTAKGVSDPNRHVELDVDIGADAKDWSAIQATEKLKPVEADLRRMEEMVSEIVSEMDYLRTREQKLRDTNESTNNRVKWFGFSTTFLLVALWVWQVLYLRAYFRFVTSGCGLGVGERCTDLIFFFTLGPSILSRMATSLIARARWHVDIGDLRISGF